MKQYNHLSSDIYPIILLHRGDSHYLSHTIAQAASSNPKCPIFLIGDSSNAYYKGVTHFYFKDYFETASDFSKVYKHKHIEKWKDWLLFCFQKNFILRDFLKQKCIKRCLLIDSDVMIYSNLHLLSPYYKNYDMTVSVDNPSHTANSGFSFINNICILDDLCNIIYDLFTAESLKKVDEMKEVLTEMKALALLAEKFPKKVKNTYFIQNHHIINHSILSSHPSIELTKNSKGPIHNIYWKNDLPYAKTVENELIPYACIHCHGHSKKYMYQYLKIKNWRVGLVWLLNITQYKIYKYPKRIINNLIRKTVFPKTL